MNKNSYTIVWLLCLFIGIILLGFFLWKTFEIETFDKEYYEKQQIVIARYNEDLNWITEEPFNRHPIIVYNKSDNTNFTKTPNMIKMEFLPNVGRESHTIFYHIITNYDNLADVTIFLSGSADSPTKFERSKNMVKKVEETNDTVLACIFYDNEDEHKTNTLFQIDTYLSSNKENSDINQNDDMQLSDTRPYGKWFEKMFTNGEKNHCVAYNSIISISREQIRQKPKSYYEELINELDKHHNPETGHYLERSWYSVFYPFTNNAAFIG